MRRVFASIVLLALTLLLQGCQDEYFEKLDDLKQRTADIESQCLKLNANIISLQAIVKAIDSNYVISSVTKIKEEGKTIINFIKIDSGEESSYTIYAGKNGTAPYVGVKQDSSGRYCWTIRKNGKEEWLEYNKEKVLAVGEVPYFRIIDGKWYWSKDRTWKPDDIEWKKEHELGPATGNDADPMFKKIDTSNEDCVVITLADDTVLKIPTLAEYQALSERVSELNEAARAQGVLIRAAVDSLVYIERVEAVLDGTDTVGTFVKLSNDDQFTVRDWKGGLVPYVRAVRDSADNVTYWAVQYGDEPYQWILAADGTRIKARSGDPVIPQVSLEQKEGNFYWKVSVKDTSWFVRNAAGDSVATAAKCVAVDSLQKGWFKSVRKTENLLEITMNDGAGTVVRLPFKFAIAFTVASVPVGDTLKVNAPDTVTVRYSAAGATIKSITVLSDGGLKVKKEPSALQVIVPSDFDEGSVMALFTFGEAESMDTRVRSIKFVRNN